MQRLAPTVGKNQKMCRREVKIIFSYFDAETTWHELEATQKADCFQGRRVMSVDGRGTDKCRGLSEKMVLRCRVSGVRFALRPDRTRSSRKGKSEKTHRGGTDGGEP